MIKTGYEIIGMIKDGKAPKKIKNSENIEYEFESDIKAYYTDGNLYLDLIHCLHKKFEIIEDSEVWKPKENEEYYVIDEYGHIQKNQCLPEIMQKSYAIGNCFKTKEEAENILEKIKIYTQLKRYAEEHNTEKIDFNNPFQSKYYIFYLKNVKELDINEVNVWQSTGQVYFTSEELCWESIQEIGEDNIKKLFEE